MSVYCTVQEAWGSNFGRRNFFQPKLDKEENCAPPEISLEKFQNATGPTYLSNSSDNPTRNSRYPEGKPDRIYQPDDDYTPSDRSFRRRCDYDEFNVAMIPTSYDNMDQKNSRKYYDFTKNDCSNPDNRGLNYTDVGAETQLFPVKPKPCGPIEDSMEYEIETEKAKSNNELCNNVAMHVMHCQECKMLVRDIMTKTDKCSSGGAPHGKKDKNDKTEKKDKKENYSDYDDDEDDLDFTEIILFIACGVFFIFLLDSIVSLGRRFR